MIKNTISISQPLHSLTYNEYMSGNAQNQKTLMNSPTNNNQNILDEIGFATELRSHNTVSALMNLNENPMQSTLQEKSTRVSGDKIISIPSTPMMSLKNVNRDTSLSIEKNLSNAIVMADKNEITMAKEKKHGVEIKNIRAFDLDGRSLSILSRISEKNREIPQLPSFEVKESTSGLLEKVVVKNTVSEVKKDILPDDLPKEFPTKQLGELSAVYESAKQGSKAIGYDRTGGTSYGTYQIASKTGTFERFLNFLDDKSPEWAEKLRNAGSANSGGRYGDVPKMWKSLVDENPEKMKYLEHAFIIDSHYAPVEKFVTENWQGQVSNALKEVIFSTAVQHGSEGAKKVFSQAFADTKAYQDVQSTEINDDYHIDAQSELIKNVYAHRKNKFGSSTAQVQEATRQRFIHEQGQALKMLG